MNEVYRSFAEKLGVENQSGYIIYESKEFYQIEFVTVWSDVKESKVRIPKDTKFDFENIERIGELQFDIENGVREGQAYYNGKWYSMETINKIQDKRQDYNWKRYV